MAPTWTLHHGDALTLLPTLINPVDAVICDPPYNSGGRTMTARTARTAREKYLTEGGRLHGFDLGTFTGDNRDQRAYTSWLSQILAHCYRLTRPGGAALVFTDWRQLAATTDALQAAGYTWRGIAVWLKPIARPQPGRLKQDSEFIVWGSAGAMIPGTDPVYLPGHFTGSQPRGKARQHITQKPLDVMQQLVRIAPPGGTVLDPFAGSGTTGAAALTEGRSFIGIEQSASYAEVARARLASHSGHVPGARAAD
ncbi:MULTISPECIES: DNA-methyltransferase [Streptomyces]|uniref:Methyltransferase n=1 Tax=Streptomyces evansiae TaxID=3075535 RepID=A0ABU2R118_9ACTN|nr:MULTISPECIES: site-specific DNA-methyltransferase [unclassified Streptomyces]MDT0409936.1 site-specific DNA-methyltransferase [Streptomyces sp. DSM 41979]MYQ59977.1 site-specific DNA-methyltransferase [Streptomyces sp. SID4926]SCE40655.1 site-specific DNA-methyltransferase (adenine-specific) [Streptomyces sp. DfronAA-171]